MVGYFTLADDVLQAGNLVREDAGEQILALHSLQLRRDLAPTGHAWQRQRGGRVPTPAHAEQRGVEQGLDQHGLGAVGVQVTPHFIEREAVAGGQRKDDRVLGRRGLQLEVEGATEAFAQRQPPGPVDPAAERRMNDQLVATGLVEEALHDQPLLRWQRAQRRTGASEVFDDLASGGFRQAEGVGEPVDGRHQIDRARRSPLTPALSPWGEGDKPAASGRVAAPTGPSAAPSIQEPDASLSTHSDCPFSPPGRGLG